MDGSHAPLVTPSTTWGCAIFLEDSTKVECLGVAGGEVSTNPLCPGFMCAKIGNIVDAEIAAQVFALFVGAPERAS